MDSGFSGRWWVNEHDDVNTQPSTAGIWSTANKTAIIVAKAFASFLLPLGFALS
jgi:hypothetical protein